MTRREFIGASVAGVGAAAGVAIAVALRGSNPSARPPVPSSAIPSPTSPPGSRTLKALIRGCLDRGGASAIPSGYRSSLAGYVPSSGGITGGVAWSAMQPTIGGPLAENNPIDQALVEVRSWNAANGAQQVLKVRVLAGIRSPAGAMTLGGGPVFLTDPVSGHSGNCPRFWSGAFGEVFYAFEALLVAEYDAVPEIAEIVLARNMTFYAEPMIRQITSKADVAALLAAGYGSALDEANQLSDIRARAVWRQTRVAITLNPYQVINSDGTVTTDIGFTQEAISTGRSALGAQAVLENNSYRQDFLTGVGAYQTMYGAMRAASGPIGLQTATIDKVGDLSTVVAGAVALGATNVELPHGYSADLTAAELGSDTSVLAANCPLC